MEKIDSRNKRRYFGKFGFQMPKAVCILMLLSTFTFANAQCDLKLTEKVTKQLKGDGLTYLKDFIIEFEEANSTQAYSLILKKDIRYLLYFGVSESYASEMKFWITPDKSNEKQVTVASGKIATLEITLEETGIYNFHVQSTKGKKSCAAIVLGVVAPEKNSEVKTVPDNEIHLIVDEMPQFMEGDGSAFQNWLQKNIIYSETIKKGIQGKVYLSFVVNTLGDVTNVKVIRGISPEIDASVINEFKKCPRWQKPGKNKNKLVNVQFVIPIAFAVKP